MLKRLLKYFNVVKKEVILAILFILLETVLETLVPFMYAQIVDVGLANRNLPYVYLWGGLMILSAGAAFFVGILSVKFVAKTGMGYGAELRRAQFEKLQSFDAENRDMFPVSSLITRLTNDTYTIQNTIIMGMRGLFRAPFMISMVLVLSFTMNKALALVLITIIPFVAASMLIIVLSVRPIFTKMQQKFDSLNRTLQENFQAIRVVKAYVTEEKEIKKFNDINIDFRKVATKGFMNVSFMNPFMQIGLYASLVGLLFVGGDLFFKGETKVGEITGLLTYVLQLMNALLMLAQLMIMFSRTIASLERIDEVLTTTPTMNYPALSKGLIREGNIKFDNVSFKYPGTSENQYVLKDINFHLDKGKVLGIIGQTGAGKSTLVHLLARMYDVSSGSILVDNIDIRDYQIDDLFDGLNIVFQSNMLFSGSILDNLYWGNENATKEEIDLALKVSLSDEIIRKLVKGLDSEVGQAGANLSGGQKQRIGLARALLKKPKVLILDDALSAIDTINEGKIRRNLKKYYPDMSLIIVSQRISAIKNADHILVLHEGRINGDGTHEELLKQNEIYRDIFETQLKGARV